MAVTGRTGADAVFKALHRICIVLTKYRTKLDTVIDAAKDNNVITTQQATDAHAFISTADTVCSIFELVAGYSGF